MKVVTANQKGTVVFACPICGLPDRAATIDAVDWQCRACDHRLHIEPASPNLPECTVCGNHELYKKKDFPHWLGMTILVGACALSVVTYGLYQKWWTWAILLGSALFDGLLYMWVGDAVVCYRCEAHYRGFTPTAAHRPFEITVGERFRQERMRRERLKKT